MRSDSQRMRQAGQFIEARDPSILRTRWHLPHVDSATEQAQTASQRRKRGRRLQDLPVALESVTDFAADNGRTEAEVADAKLLKVYVRSPEQQQRT